ncbi:type VI secretion system-associated protein TagF [Paucibacter sp. R3-3]|uniref:Type VI secretion system-associated protein TagF n=1 Tax=Roseateles agri TaxID=3098619 RepID=A0ABU5DAJ6_9BURK|nr:type VI secretion system-associated protein TagF [Paucibacter sp. R3-3]MDY0743306.1 type VI secretion system-associated protein TagF [Paucibacter sp. R3-3]
MDEAAGWFGKLSSLGDFAQRRVSAQWVGICDDWLSASMLAGREQLHEHWVEAYLRAPVLRFGWAPGVVDAQWWFGVLMPSCDNVGRYFPLLVAQPRPRPPEDRAALEHLERWFDHIAAATIQTLSDAGGSVDDFEALLHDAPPWPAVLSPASSSPAHVPLMHWLEPLVAARWTQELAGHSLWWRIDPQTAERDSMQILKGLPNGEQFVDLICGD